MPSRQKKTDDSKNTPFTLSDDVQLHIAGPERDEHTESVGFEPLLPISSMECLSTKQPSTLRKRMESLSFSLSFFFFPSRNSLLNLRSLLTGTNIFHKKVPFHPVSIFAYKQIDCGKIPTKIYFGVFQKKKSCKGEL